MKTITLECEIISPMFVGGASRDSVELNAKSIKASLMFWWRAIHPNLSVVDLKHEEALFFGGKNRDGTNVKPFFRFLDISYEENSKRKFYIDEREDKVDRHGNRMQKHAIKPSTNFHIEIQILKEEKKVLAIFKLASALGGLGNRSRRGAGAWKINKINFPILENKKVMYSQKNIGIWIKILNKKYKKDTYKNNEFPFLKKFKIGEESYEVNDLRKRIMLTAHDCKEKYKVEKIDRRGNTKDTFPLYEKYLGKAFNGRLASPVYVSMIQTKNGIYPIITVLNTEQDDDSVMGEKLQNEFINAILTNTEIGKNV